MRILFTLLFCCFSILLFSQEKQELAIKYAKTITEGDLSKHLHVLASDEYGGRETGKESLNLAADYIQNFYKQVGIVPLKNQSYYQTYQVGIQEAKGVDIQLDGKSLSLQKDFYYFPSYHQKLSSQTAEVVFLGYGIETKTYSDYKDIDVTGKIVMILSGEPKNKDGDYFVSGTNKESDWSNPRLKLKNNKAKEKGALAVLVVDKNFNETVKTWGHYMDGEKMKVVSDGLGYDFPRFYISDPIATQIIGKPLDKIIKKISSKRKTVTVTSKSTIKLAIDKKTNISDANNVLAYVEGSDKKEELVVVSAHYDHIGKHDGEVFNGADDDGSGTVAVMEMAEAFMQAKKEGNGPRRSILFLNVSGEEKGLLGSKHYADHPVFPLENTVANLNIDMIGRLDEAHADNENYIYIIGSNFLSNDLHDINEQINNTYTNLDLDYTYNNTDDPNRYYYRSDHYNFAKNNIPVIFYFNGVHEDYHQASDTVDKILFGKMEKITRLVFYTAWELVNRDERIQLNETLE